LKIKAFSFFALLALIQPGKQRRTFRGSVERYSALIVSKKLSLRTTRGMQAVQLKHPPIDVRGNPNFGSMLEGKGWTHLDGYVDPSPAVVIPEHLRIMEFGAGSLSATLSIPVQSFLEQLTDGLTLLQPEQIAADEES
jgi:hypothetical protein